MSVNRVPKIACIGRSSWDRLITVLEYPPIGGQADVLEEVSAPGGTTTNTAVALARLGAETSSRTSACLPTAGYSGTAINRSQEESPMQAILGALSRVMTVARAGGV